MARTKKSEEPEGIDGETIARFVAQDEAAMTAVFKAYKKVLHARVCHILSDRAPELAQEASSETWHRITRYASKFQGTTTSKLEAWMTAVARNVCMDVLQKTPLTGAIPLHEGESGDAPIEVADRAPGPEEATQAKELSTAVQAALAKLSPEEREALVLHKVEGANLDRIAELMGVHRNTVKARIRSALERMKTLLQDWKDDS